MLTFSKKLLSAQNESSEQLTLLVFLSSIFLTFLFRVTLPTTWSTDSTDYTTYYEPVARNVLAGYGFILADGTLATANPPGYSLLLAGLFGLSQLLSVPEEVVLTAFILLCMGGISMFIYSLAQRMWGTWSALASALVWMTYPFAVGLTLYPHTELPFLLVFYGGFYFLWSALLDRSRAWPVYFLVGLLAGMAMLIRTIAVGGGLLMGLTIWLVAHELTVRFRLFLITLVLLGNLAVVLPWEAWLYLRTGSVILLGTNGAASIRDGLTFAVNSKTYRQTVKVPPDVIALMQDALILTRKSKMNSLGEIASIMMGELQTRPLTVAKLLIIKATRSWYGTDSGRYEALILLAQSIYFVPLIWGSRAAWKRGGTSRQLAISIWLIGLYFWGMTLLALSILRYMIPIMGLLFILLPGAFLTERLRNSC